VAMMYREHLERAAEHDRQKYGEKVVVDDDYLEVEVQEKNSDFFHESNYPSPKLTSLSDSSEAKTQRDLHKSSIGKKAISSSKNIKLGNKMALGAKKVTTNLDELELRAKEAEIREEGKKTKEFSLETSVSAMKEKDELRATQDDNLDQLGMRFGNLGFKTDNTNIKETSKTKSLFEKPSDLSSNSYNDDTTAQKRYADAKSISSDDFFGRNKVAKDSNESISSRFRGATAISSADVHGEGDDSSHGIEEYTASDFAREFAGQAMEDLRTLKSVMRLSGQKLQDFAHEFIDEMQTRYYGS